MMVWCWNWPFHRHTSVRHGQHVRDLDLELGAGFIKGLITSVISAIILSQFRPWNTYPVETRFFSKSRRHFPSNSSPSLVSLNFGI